MCGFCKRPGGLVLPGRDDDTRVDSYTAKKVRPFPLPAAGFGTGSVHQERGSSIRALNQMPTMR